MSGLELIRRHGYQNIILLNNHGAFTMGDRMSSNVGRTEGDRPVFCLQIGDNLSARVKFLVRS